MRSLLCFICCVVFTIHTNAQYEDQDQRKLKFGISGGFNLTQTPAISYIDISPSFNNYRKSKYALGASVKLMMEYQVSQRFSLQPEVGFTYYHQKQVYRTIQFFSRFSEKRNKIN